MAKNLSGPSLWRQPDFLKLWTGQTISLFGTQVTFLALPLTAILMLGASPAQMGLLAAAQTVPWLLAGLLAGVVVDRVRRRPLMIAADLGRMIVLATIPIAAALGSLQLAHLYGAAFLLGILSVFFEAAEAAFLPTLVGRAQLVDGNTKLEMSRSVVQVVGPGAAGWLVQILTAPVTILLDAASFLVSALFLSLIRIPEPRLPGRTRRNIWAEIGEGVAALLGNPVLRAIAGSTATSSFFIGMVNAVYLLYLTGELGLEPGVVGMILLAFGAGWIPGTVLAGGVARRLGLGPTMLGAALLSSLASLGIPLAGRLPVPVVPLLLAMHALFGLLWPISTITTVSLRQMITPDALQGRVNASQRFLVMGTTTLGSLVGGVLGELIGLRPALVVATAGLLSAILWLLHRPVRTLGSLPVPGALDPSRTESP